MTAGRDCGRLFNDSFRMTNPAAAPAVYTSQPLVTQVILWLPIAAQNEEQVEDARVAHRVLTAFIQVFPKGATGVHKRKSH